MEYSNDFYQSFLGNMDGVSHIESVSSLHHLVRKQVYSFEKNYIYKCLEVKICGASV